MNTLTKPSGDLSAYVRKATILFASLALLAGSRAQAANRIWNGGSPVDGNWTTILNWGNVTAPGSTSSTTSADTATFNAAIAHTWGNSAANPIVIDSGRNIASLIFNNAATGPYFIGTTGGNALHLTSNSGANQVNMSAAAVVATETINCPLVLEPPNNTTAGAFNFRNVSTSGGILNLGGSISGGATSAGISLSLVGSSTTANTISGVISDGGAVGFVSLTKAGNGGLWVLSAPNTFSGGVTLTAGILNVNYAENAGVSGPLGKSGTISFGGATLQYSSANNYDYSSRFSTAASQSYNVDTAGQAVTWAANLTSSGGTLTKSGTGTLTLSGAANTYSGGTSLNGGTLNLANVSALGATANTLTYNSVATGQLSTDTAFGSGANPVYNVNVTGSSSYNGTMTLNRATAGASTGMTHNFGLLTISLANVAGGLNVLAGAKAPTGGAVDTLAFTGLSYGNWYSVSETIAPVGANVTLGTVTPQANNNGSAAAVQTLVLDGTSAGNQITGIISDNTSGSAINQGAITKSSSSIWTLSGPNTYTGNTIISGGTLALGANNVLPTATTVNLAGGTLAMSTFNNTVNALQASGVVQAKGTWGASGSGANHISASMTGSGILTVTTGGSTAISVSSGGASTYGGSVTFTATVTGSSGDGTTPVGTVTFYDGGVSISTGSLSGSGLVATATLNTSALTAGTHTITASYGGNASYDLSGVSGNYSQVVSQAPSTATISVANSPVTYNGSAKSATFTLSGTNTIGAVSNVLYGGSSTVPTNSGTYVLTADFVPANTNYTKLTGQPVTGTFVISKATPTATLAVNNTPQTYTGSAQTATVTISASSVPGSVANILTGGTATKTAAGTYAVTADFVPTDSANYNTLTAQSAGNFVINQTVTTISYTGTQPFTYDGTPKSPTIGIAGSTGMRTTNYTGTGYASVNAPTNTGSYTLTVAVLSDANYIGATNGQAFTIIQASTFVGASSSRNPSGYKDAVSFLSTLPSDATGSVIFSSTNGAFSTNTVTGASTTSLSITNLPRGTNVITAAYLGDGNYVGSTNSLNQIVTNHRPVAANATYYRAKGLSLKIAINNLLSNVTDVDGDTISLSSVDAGLTNATIMTNGTYVFYLPGTGAGSNDNDVISYTVSDGFGGTATANILINVYSATGSAEMSLPTNGVVNIKFFGIPNYTYVVQTTTNLSVPWWTLSTNTAGTNGSWLFTDPNATNAQQYYRSAQP